MAVSLDQGYSNLQTRRKGPKLWFKQLPITTTHWSSQVLLELLALFLPISEGYYTISFFNSLTEISENLGVPMVGINCDQIETKFEERESMMK